MFIRFHISWRGIGLLGFGGLALVLAGCSPGTMTIKAVGSNLSSADRLTVSVNCPIGIALSGPGPVHPNCSGVVVGTIDGKPLVVAGRMIGGFGDMNNPLSGSISLPFPFGSDCLSAPCSTLASAGIAGLGHWGIQKVSVGILAYDNSAPPSNSDEVTLDFTNGPPVTFTCATDCVTIHMKPFVVAP